MSDFCIAIGVISIAVLAIMDFLFLRWARRRNHKFHLPPNEFLPSGRRNRNYPNGDTTPPCWPYGWPNEE